VAIRGGHVVLHGNTYLRERGAGIDSSFWNLRNEIHTQRKGPQSSQTR
jgi:hypothetical protein